MRKCVTVCGRQCKFCGFRSVCGRQCKFSGFRGVKGGVPPGGLRGRSPLGGLGAEPPVRLRIREAEAAYLSLTYINGH